MAKGNDKHRGNGNGSGKNQNDGKGRSIGEDKSDQDRIRKGAEITPRPEKPKGNDSSNNK
jgi:hypothetical protein